MSKLVQPHGGGSLAPRLVGEAEREAALARAAGLRAVPLSSRETSDLVMLAMGAYTPLAGFMGHDDWHRVCTEMKLASGLFWPIPITLSCTQDLADSIADGEEVALTDEESGRVMALMTVGEKYAIDRHLECSTVFRTTDGDHPGVAKVMTQGAVNLAGPVKVLGEGSYRVDYEGLYLRPAETRALFTERGWRISVLSSSVSSSSLIRGCAGYSSSPFSSSACCTNQSSRIRHELAAVYAGEA